MKGKLIAAVLVAACALAALLYLARESTAPAVSAWAEETRQETTSPTERTESTVELLLNSLTLEQKVGQLFLVRCPKTEVEEAISQYHLGGLLLYDRDIEGETQASLREKIAAYQSAAELPLLIAVDEEGGNVARVSGHTAMRSERFSSPRELYSLGGLDAVLAAEEEKAELLSSLGINVNLAPVCDISTQSDAFMYSRSLGQSAEITGQFATGTIQTMRDFGVEAVMKHFPGYGNNADTHVGIVRDERTLEELESVDLQPFFDGIAAGGNAILVSHNIVEAMDADTPASLSETVHQYLRLAMGFDGVIMTDDLYMDAITQMYGVGEAAVLAVLAGNDLLCSTEYEEQYAAVLEACQQGRISEELLNQAVERVLRWKEKMGLELPAE